MVEEAGLLPLLRGFVNSSSAWLALLARTVHAIFKASAPKR